MNNIRYVFRLKTDNPNNAKKLIDYLYEKKFEEYTKAISESNSEQANILGVHIDILRNWLGQINCKLNYIAIYISKDTASSDIFLG